MTEKELKEYKDFMVNPCNSHKCDACPANEQRIHTTERVLPCGQYHCWVDVHISTIKRIKQYN